jgi:serine/threonine-protein kinase SRK2
MMLDNYTYVGPLLPGHYSVTKLYKDNITGEQVAIKFIQLKNGQVPTVIKNEIDIFSKLSHPSIVKYIDSFMTETSLCIVMEYVSGGDLHGIVSDKGQLPEKVVRNYMLQLLDVLEYLDQNKISHKDIKLENILVSEDGMTIKLCDFGFATYYDSDDIHKKYGTPSYMAPELIQNRIVYPEVLDVWSCGVLMYIMIYGFFPFEDRMRPYNIALLLRNITRCNYFIPRTVRVSRDAVDFLMSMLVLDERERATITYLKNHPWLSKANNMIHDIDKSTFQNYHDNDNILYQQKSRTTKVA